MLENVKKLFGSFNSNLVQYCNWKGTSKIDDGLAGNSDIDILLSKNSKELATSILKKNEFLLVKTQWECRFKDVEDWVGFDAVMNNTQIALSLLEDKNFLFERIFKEDSDITSINTNKPIDQLVKDLSFIL